LWIEKIRNLESQIANSDWRTQLKLFGSRTGFEHPQPDAGFTPEERSGRCIGEAEPEIIRSLVGVVTMLGNPGESVTDQAGFRA
jgi:hypothetical protein